jgi:hypothetical protein
MDEKAPETSNKGILAYIKSHKEVILILLGLTGYEGYDAYQPDAKEDTIRTIQNHVNDMDNDVMLNNEFRVKYWDREDSPEKKAEQKKAIEADQMVEILVDVVNENKADIKDLEREVHSKH